MGSASLWALLLVCPRSVDVKATKSNKDAPGREKIMHAQKTQRKHENIQTKTPTHANETTDKKQKQAKQPPKQHKQTGNKTQTKHTDTRQNKQNTNKHPPTNPTEGMGRDLAPSGPE